MALKYGDQHAPLHETWGLHDCCLCRVERERDEYKKDLEEAMECVRYVACSLSRFEAPEDLIEKAKALIKSREDMKV
jgi:hypothetical protein